MKMPDTLMMQEMSEGALIFAKASVQSIELPQNPAEIDIFTRESSDAVAKILSCEFIGRLGIPVTSLLPSVISLGAVVQMTSAMALLISQSCASDNLVEFKKSVERSVAVTNVTGSAVKESASLNIPLSAGIKKAVPATKTVFGSISAGMALLAALTPH